MDKDTTLCSETSRSTISSHNFLNNQGEQSKFPPFSHKCRSTKLTENQIFNNKNALNKYKYTGSTVKSTVCLSV